jgi:hypothetical protein
MKKWFWMVGAMLLVATPLHAYVSVGSILRRPVSRPPMVAPPGSDDPAPAPYQNLGLKEIKGSHQPGEPVPEPGTMAITAMGLLAAAAFRRKRRPQ